MTDLPALIVYETIDLGLSPTATSPGSRKASNDNELKSFLQPLETNWPVMTTDPIYQDMVFIYHSFGVHSLNMANWLQPLIRSMQTGIDERIDSIIQKGLATEVSGLFDTSSIGLLYVPLLCLEIYQRYSCRKTDPIFGVALPSDIYLSYCVVALTRSLVPYTIELSFRLGQAEKAEEDVKQDPELSLPEAILEAVPDLQTKDSSLISLLSKDPYIPPPAVSLPESIEAVKKLGRPVTANMKKNLVITPELLREFATIVQRFQSHIRDTYLAINGFQDRMILQDQEFHRQQAKYTEILERIKKFKEEDNIKLKQRFERCLADQKRLLARSDKILQKTMDATSPTLSEQEKRWFAELNRMKMEVIGETNYDSSSLRARTDTVCVFAAALAVI